MINDIYEFYFEVLFYIVLIKFNGSSVSKIIKIDYV